MDNHIITILQNFEKPETSFLKDKECLICLETFDLESTEIVKLPCKCANSVYHIVCIVQLLHSGENKNFCPHCKTKYEMPLQTQIQVSRHQVLPYIVISTEISRTWQLQDLQITKITYILIIHILFNSIMNVINIVVARNAFDTNVNEELHLCVFQTPNLYIYIYECEI